MVRYEQIETDKQLDELCERLRTCHRIAFDTEFVSEDTYRPELCLVQVASEAGYAIIDPQGLDITPFWQLLLEPGMETICHAGREEYRFLKEATGSRAHHWYDVQIAAGMVGREFPASYGSLVSRLLGKSLPKGETRTDWRKRPLTSRQLDYAVQDVVHLFPLRDKLGKQLADLGREAWLEEELNAWQDKLDSEEQRDRWRRVSGISQLSPRGLAIVREVWRWREQEAQALNRPPKRVLRDDLMVEMAKRQLSSPDQLRSVRGMERRSLQKSFKEIAAAVQRGLALPDKDCPKRANSKRPPLTLLGQFLASALSSVCRDANVAPSLVGGAEAVRDLVAQQLDVASRDAQPALLASGWRGELVGHALTQVLEGKKAICVDDPLSEQPLKFVDL